ncbi:hypothetical protein Syn7803C102_182 [Synechococcus phage ACG-2014d]|uniref:Phage tail lysozyme domain-containing protein n=1 Tax=Synechococcus phage ACG-2014d TaxID=1493509 RepID=A0A0E3FF86_9CAUD|nr:hypothetical protein AAJ59_gp182 [Synechococcus phage ACG-2014d]AIX16088.1 hypothetical protein Syn7803C54_183 [Synechococcus phage ACG-2014d]AIX21070.1 hypothetical protein Syn7803C88_182 [Synechococcus phage ACG-2014d]AIX25396.1 hypothetical protein Syn7803US111_181 [Synechococcus phage ACG-2014d]AIX26261.1 hypothetical protein Syn7803US115_181 [Synechococcus phage ACG-2014d]AIX35305.1 hypothetical protein Syn7803US61_181 [Synechococcus phage ACG-2014d]
MRKMILPTLVMSTAVSLAAVPSFLMTLPEAPPLPDGVAEVVEPSWQCPTCSVEEQYVLKELQAQTKITDKNALATLMGNIKQESKFIPNICEGGAIVPYENCLSGGYGLIQWTSAHRYRGLGTFCGKFSCDPSSLEGQTRWMINEPIFQRVLPEFERRGDTIPQYMTHAYYWLGWGIKGNREVYAWDYESKLTWV